MRDRLAELAATGHRHALVDATRDEHLTIAGAACVDLALTTGGAGLAVGLARALRSQALGSMGTWMRPKSKVPVAWLSSSCSEATRRQLAAARIQVSGTRLDPMRLAADDTLAARIAAEVAAQSATMPRLVYATATPAEVSAAQAALGAARTAHLIEDAFRTIAQALHGNGVRAFVVAGGETSGAVVEALGVHALAIGPEIDLGVPWTRSVGGDELWLALKSGNFGSDDFFTRATEML